MIKLKVDMLRKAQKMKGWNNTRLAKKMGVNRDTLRKVMLPENHPKHINVGAQVIEGALMAFPELTFEDLFYLECREGKTNVARNKQREATA